MADHEQYVIIGAGVVGLTTALELKRQRPACEVIITAKDLPGDSSPTYASAWAGANWISCATDNGCEEQWDKDTYQMFEKIVLSHPEAGIENMSIRSIYDDEIEKVGILSDFTGKIWYDKLVGGLHYLAQEELPDGAKFGFDAQTFVINVQVYLPWLQQEATRQGVEIRRGLINDIADVKSSFPHARAVFNCTGLGSLHLGGVKDSKLYPSKVLLVENPSDGIHRMYYRSSRRLGSHNTYVFPRGKHGGVILGGCRLNDNWDPTFDPALGESIKQKCCSLAPELGKPDDLRVLQQGVGFRRESSYHELRIPF
ncbi:unnamed protein product [Penicillium salamii]|nr:unnamed protein product [Penicillium salamii]